MSGEYNLRENIFTEFSWNSVVFKLKFSLTVDQQVSVFSNYIAVLGVTGIGVRCCMGGWSADAFRSCIHTQSARI